MNLLVYSYCYLCYLISFQLAPDTILIAEFFFCSYYQIIVVEVNEKGSPPPDASLTITRYYNNKTEGEPYITAEFAAAQFDQYKDFVVGNGEKFSVAAKRKKRSGKTQYFSKQHISALHLYNVRNVT